MNETNTRRTLSVAEVADLVGATIEGGDSSGGGLLLTGPAGLDAATPDEVSFLAQETYAHLLATTRAGAVLVGRGVEVPDRGFAVLRCDDPERAFTKVVLALTTEIPKLPVGVADGARIDSTASVGDGVRIHGSVTVGPDAIIGDGVTLAPGVCVGAQTRIGAETVVHPNVTLYPRTEVGERCIIHAGTVIGSEGFGFHREPSGWKKTPQVGRVVIADDVEIGANVAIDCARFGATRIGRGSKIDNLVHIAHNVVIGEDCLILALVGIAGSTTLEDDVIMAGQAGIKGHARVGRGARIAGHSGVTKDVPAGEDWFGFPAGPSAQKMRSLIGAERAGAEVRTLKKQLRALEQQVARLTEAATSGDTNETPIEG